MSNTRKKAVKKLASGPIRTNKGKYSVMIFSIILTTVLFSSLFTIVGSLLSEFRQSSMGQYDYMDPSAALICVAALVIFMVSGYLIINNIFDINIVSEMKEYGLLKTIGTSGKQIRRIVKYRTRRICLIAIPIGLAIGCGIGGWMLPMIGRFINTVGANKGQVHMSIWIILFTAFFSYITVAISGGKPRRKASKISPVEASRYNGNLKKNGKPKKKVILVVLSLSFSLVILNSAYTLMSSFSTDSYAEEYIVCDFCVQDELLDNAGQNEKNVNAVDSVFFDELSKQQGVESIGNLYLNHESYTFSPEVWNEIEKYFFSDEVVKMQIESFYAGDGYTVKSYLKDLHNKRAMEGNTYGMSKMTVEKLYDVQTMDGATSVDWEKFNSGNYVLAERWQYSNDGFLNVVNPGDKVEIGGREYTVYASVDIPMVIEYPVYGPIECNFILPEDEYLSIYGEVNPMRTLIDVNDGCEEGFEEWIKGYTADSNLSYTSKKSVIEDNRAFGELFAIAGLFVAVILGLIGVMNFGNTMIASIISRSRELAVLEAVGMTEKQQKRSLLKDGFRYFTYTSILSVVLSSIINVTAVKSFVNNLPMFSWRFSLTSLALCLPVILVIILIIPAAAYKRLSRRSVVDRLRME
ncbi:putative ABC transport system permease protein [Eubacterium ruminantium]|uniref:Putative ABC transport system permease protein n=2 Tax=Eubacteriaceae TaxID=186806 RepID=A0A1T4PBN8_9FIRM|nr:putative ABC transport system permease protein [Eubacterium ruminantium]SDM97913.1 putative ABC transport system permease protein [Eubacterium ruminantium]SJZ88248.1 putative ABC transport system permease protein [Eubacterium ruminantium]